MPLYVFISLDLFVKIFGIGSLIVGLEVAIRAFICTLCKPFCENVIMKDTISQIVSNKS